MIIRGTNPAGFLGRGSIGSRQLASQYRTLYPIDSDAFSFNLNFEQVNAVTTELLLSGIQFPVLLIRRRGNS